MSHPGVHCFRCLISLASLSAYSYSSPLLGYLTKVEKFACLLHLFAHFVGISHVRLRMGTPVQACFIFVFIHVGGALLRCHMVFFHTFVVVFACSWCLMAFASVLSLACVFIFSRFVFVACLLLLAIQLMVPHVMSSMGTGLHSLAFCMVYI